MRAGDRVVEVGAGLGSLTVALAATGADVLAIEFDRALVPALEEVVAGALGARRAGRRDEARLGCGARRRSVDALREPPVQRGRAAGARHAGRGARDRTVGRDGATGGQVSGSWQAGDEHPLGAEPAGRLPGAASIVRRASSSVSASSGGRFRGRAARPPRLAFLPSTRVGSGASSMERSPNVGRRCATRSDGSG